MGKEPGNNVSGGGIGLVGAVFVALLVLKLLGKTTLSWWVVTAPLWGGFVLVFGIFFAALAIAAIAESRKR